MKKEFNWQDTSGDMKIDVDDLIFMKTPLTDQQYLAEKIKNAGAKLCITGIHDDVMTLIYTERQLHLPLIEHAKYVRLSLSPLCEIMAFLDECQQMPGDNNYKEFLLNMDVGSYDKLNYWFICCYLMGSKRDDYEELLAYIRRQEPYFLTSYLIKNRCSHEKIHTLCERYGLSYSYFRKISKKYLGVSAKTKMSEWRMAQTILDILENDSSITDIALKNGYSSSAHVCSTFKSVLGLSPYAIRKINGK
ncbi:hypothetical protein AC791_14420 [Klebsiella sp. RIT-PI-d]|uniref:helix-turn-helix domain-containing protein n=1 Tax=Klebsiella sp. RIT-PI-d TaxID=1681196 RepID=UPI00067636C7|nr:helix-turn-helix domain-containing protein [Klebsiella sp. RIT-PI-d]KNC09811.1 hypothetical protein AC791_14420 [Klebsiella sp. RIT-PI-d]